jgi:hypothetical protein
MHRWGFTRKKDVQQMERFLISSFLFLVACDTLLLTASSNGLNKHSLQRNDL